VRQLLSGELWGRLSPVDLVPKVRAYRGPLLNGQQGIEFWAFQAPDRPFGPRAQWSSPGPYVTIDSMSETAKMKVAFALVTQELLTALK
jgi:hypothetical protein